VNAATGELECTPRDHCWTDEAGVEHCVPLFNSSCVETNRTNTSECECVCEPGYIPHPFPLDDLSTSNVGSTGQDGRRWLWFCIDVDECHDRPDVDDEVLVRMKLFVGNSPVDDEVLVRMKVFVGGLSWPSHNCDEHATCSNTVGSFTCECGEGFVGNGTHCIERCNCTLHGDELCASHSSEQCRGIPPNMCQHLHASSCEEEHLPDGSVRCVCTCPPGQHAETVPESTHLAANLAPGRVFCEDDCNCSRFHRCAGPEDVLECPPPPSSDLQECKPKYHCWDDASGYTTCRKLHPSNCSDTNSSHCNCTCPVPETRNPRPGTRDPRPETRNTKHETRNLTPAILKP
jgi:hypothetical protein